MAQINDTWAEIGEHIADGSYRTRYSVGDTKSLDIKIDGQRTTIDMQIAAFDEDTLFDEPKKAHITWVSQKIITERAMNGDSTNRGGWMLSDMRAHCTSLYYGILDEDAIALIKPVRKLSYHFDTQSSHTTKDYCWIPSHREVFGSTAYEKDGAKYTRLFENETHMRYDSHNKAGWWWLRSASLDYPTCFRHVRHNGGAFNHRAQDEYGVVLGFCTSI